MRLVTKKIRVIEMTEQELKTFQELMNKAAEGHMSHYAEATLNDGTYLGVSVLTPEQVREREAAVDPRFSNGARERDIPRTPPFKHKG